MSRKIGFWAVFALVTGSQIGSGVFMMPASLAPFGLYSLAGWLISGVGAMMLALVFANLCAHFPRTGGPHVYVEETFGPVAGYYTGWTYWVISWVSSIAVITASIGYLLPLLGPSSSPWMPLALQTALLLTITAVNLKGVKTAGNTEFFLTVLKFIPLILLPLAGFFFFKLDNFIPLEVTRAQDLSPLIKQAALLTMWCFIGLECATTPAGSVHNPSKTIPRAVIFGTLSVAILYLFNSLGIMGAVPNGTLLASKAPYADVVQTLFGGNWHLLISAIAAVVCIGTLNAWTLASGQIALGLAQDGLLPSFFAKTNQAGAPVTSLIISCIGIFPLLLLTQNESLAHQIHTVIDFSVTAFLFVYTACCLAYIRLLFTQQIRPTVWGWISALLALSFCLWVISASSLDKLLTAGAFVFSGIPVFCFMRMRTKKASLAQRASTPPPAPR